LWSPPDKAGRRERLDAGALQVLLCAERGAFVGTDRREHQALAEAKQPATPRSDPPRRRDTTILASMEANSLPVLAQAIGFGAKQ